MFSAILLWVKENGCHIGHPQGMNVFLLWIASQLCCCNLSQPDWGVPLLQPSFSLVLVALFCTLWSLVSLLFSSYVDSENFAGQKSFHGRPVVSGPPDKWRDNTFHLGTWENGIVATLT